MKYFILLIFLFCLISKPAISSEYFNAERMGVDFMGVCHNDQVVIAYGTGGIILLSYDKGLNWEQKQIFHDSVTIIKIIPFGNEFFGFNSNLQLFKLNKLGEVTNNISIVTQKIFDLSSGNSEIICLTQTGIDLYNTNLELKNSININNLIKPKSISFFREKFYISTGNGKIITINIPDNYSLKEHDISSIGSWADYFKIDSDFLYSVIGGTIFKTTDGDNWIEVGQPSTNYKYFVNNNEVYDLRINSNPKWNFYWIELFKLGMDKKFYKLSKDTIDRFVNLSILQCEFINNDTFIAVGYNKTIYLSTDRGISWVLKSNLGSSSNEFGRLLWLDKNNGYYAVKNQVFKTIDSGITWLPQKYTDTAFKYFKYANNFYIDKTGKGFVFYCSISSYQDSVKDMNFIYTLDSGNTFKYKYIAELKYWGSDLFFTPIKIKDGYRIILSPGLGATLTFNTFTHILDLDSNFNLVNSHKIDSIKLLYYINEKPDLITAFAMENRYPNKNTSLTNMIFDSTKYWIMSSSDEGKTWEKSFECRIDSAKNLFAIDWKDNNLFLLYNKADFDSIKYKYYNQVSYFYNLDLTNKKINQFYTDTSNTNHFEFYYNKKVYIKNCRGELLCSNNFQDGNPVWDTAFIQIKNYKYIYDYFVPPDESCIYARVVQADSRLNIYKFRKQIPTKVDDGELEIVNSDYIYAERPRPMPANNKVRLIIFESSVDDITNAQINIYDYLGNKVSNGNDVERIAHSTYKGEISWDCSSVIPGVYFVRFDFKTAHITVPVVVVR
jgi:hypothetical protein